ncbi:four-carbon acid sugar kinase family protein [Salipiger mucosus]|nr:four-carbon acid sugar kinase family protein [Salipiger mucosus]
MTEQIFGARRVVIVADDLTGALDATAPFAARGLSACVATRPDGLMAALAEDAAVTAVSTRSREIAPDAARDRVARAIAEVPADALLFKKVDSRLKGPLEAELSALPALPLLVVPAIPDFGRVVRDGAVSGFGVEDPIDIRARLGAAAERAVIPDVTSAYGMRRALAEAPEGAVLVGARGVAETLAESMGGATNPAPELSGPIAVAVGSTDPITLAQLDALRAAGATVLEAPGGRFDGAPPDGDVAVLQATEEVGGNLSGPEVAAALGAAFPAIAQGRNGWVLTGGATAEAVLDAAGITRLEVLGEALPGLPLSRAGTLRVVTKSGGFGLPDTLVRLTHLDREAAR